MNKLPLAKRVMILTALCEGVSMRSISRMADVSINTVTKLLVDAGETCLALHDELVRDVRSQRIQADEIWSFVGCKNRNVINAKAPPMNAGDVWTWTAIDADTKLMVSYFVGDHSGGSAVILADDLRSRIASEDGNPDERHISTSYVERANLSIRMQNRRFTRLTNAFSKKFQNHVHMLALYFAFYNFVRIHKTLRMTPAMAAGVSKTLWTMEDIAERIEARRPKAALGKRGPRGAYKKRERMSGT